MSNINELVFQIAELKRQMHSMLRVGTVTEVDKDKVRVNWAKSRDEGGGSSGASGGSGGGSSSGGGEGGSGGEGGGDSDGVKSPWVQTHDFRGGARKRSFFKKGQTVMQIAPGGDLQQSFVIPGPPSKKMKPPEHANDTGQDEEVYQQEKLRERRKGKKWEMWLEDEKQEDQNSGSSGAGGGSGASGGQQQKQTEKEPDWKKVHAYIGMDEEKGLVIKSKKPIRIKVGDDLDPKNDEKGTYHLFEKDKITSVAEDGQKVVWKKDETSTEGGNIYHDDKRIDKTHVHAGVQPGSGFSQFPKPK